MSSSRIHFILGKEFSNMVDDGSLNLTHLADSFDELQESTPMKTKEEKFFSEMIFYSAQTSQDDIQKIAKPINFSANDIIVAASAGGHFANSLVQELKKRDIVPTILAFEAYGLEEQPGVVYFRQHGNPNGLVERDNQDTYEYQDGTRCEGKLLIGHAAYTIRQEAVSKLEFLDQDIVVPEAKNEFEEKNSFLLIKNASLDIDGKNFQYHWLVGKEQSTSSDTPQFATGSSALVFNFGFILKLAYIAAKKLDPATNLTNQYAVKAIHVSTKKTLETPPPVSAPLMSEIKTVFKAQPPVSKTTIPELPKTEPEDANAEILSDLQFNKSWLESKTSHEPKKIQNLAKNILHVIATAEKGEIDAIDAFAQIRKFLTDILQKKKGFLDFSYDETMSFCTTLLHTRLPNCEKLYTDALKHQTQSANSATRIESKQPTKRG